MSTENNEVIKTYLKENYDPYDLLNAMDKFLNALNINRSSLCRNNGFSNVTLKRMFDGASVLKEKQIDKVVTMIADEVVSLKTILNDIPNYELTMESLKELLNRIVKEGHMYSLRRILTDMGYTFSLFECTGEEAISNLAYVFEDVETWVYWKLEAADKIFGLGDILWQI